MRGCTRTLGSALLATACLLGALPLATAPLGVGARPALAAAADGGGLLEPTPLILKDGRIAHVSIHLIPFEEGRGELGQDVASRLDRLTRGVATDCFLTAQVIGHVEPSEVEGGNTLGAHRLARARADVVQGMLVDGGLPAKSIASVWDWQFLVREPRVTLWLFRLSEGEDCDGTPLRPGAAPAQVAAAEPAATAAPPPPPPAPAPASDQPPPPPPPQRTEVAGTVAETEPADADPGALAPAPQAAESPVASLPVATAETPQPPAPAAAVAVAPAPPSKPAPVPPPQDIRTTELAPSPPPPPAPPPPAPSAGGGDAAEAAIGTQARAITPDRELLAVVAPRGEAPTAGGAGGPGAAQPAPARQQPGQPAARAQPQQPQQQATPPPPPPAPPVTTARAVEPPARQPAAAAQPAQASGGAAGGPVQITFPVNSSYFGEDARRDLAELVRSIRAGQRYRVQLTASVGTGDVQVVSHEDAVRYNRWLATRRLERVQEWLQENADAELQIEPDYREDPSRQVEVRVMPAG
jgi:outer membrane protein OmpA-like peptidoglycan-associated protein